MKTQPGTLLTSTAFLIIALVFTSAGLWAIATIGWTEIYADQWRLYPLYLELPFPHNVLALENGHRPVFPGLLRVAEMHWLNGNQLLQLFSGALFATATVVALSACAWRSKDVDAVSRSAAIALAAFAVFWLGNARMLLHGNESVHAYLLTACVAGGIVLVLRDSLQWPKLLLAGMLAFVATFSFGPGLAAFPALIVLLIIQRQNRAAAAMTGLLAITAAIYFVLPSATGVSNSLSLRPLGNLLTAATWLASMPVNLFLSVLDPRVGASLPEWLYSLVNPVAHAYRGVFGDIHTEHIPATVAGLAAMAFLFWTTISTWRTSEPASALRLAGLGLAWFAFGIAGIVAIGRLAYFEAAPDQIFANRYLPWSCLFWLGLFWILLGRRTSGSKAIRYLGLTSAGLVLAFGLATQEGHRIWGSLVKDEIRLDAASFAIGLIEAEKNRFGEGYASEIEAGLPAVRRAQLSMFSWPETRLLGTRLPESSSSPLPVPMTIEVSRPVRNRLGPEPGSYLQIRFDRPGSVGTTPEQLLLLDQDQRAVGLMVRSLTRPETTYRGYAIGPLNLGNLILSDLEGRIRMPLSSATSPAVSGVLESGSPN